MAMHCIVRDQSPRDYAVMVEVAHESLEGLTEKTEKLLQPEHSVSSAVKLTRRERKCWEALCAAWQTRKLPRR
jgi:hypothetical protein